MGKPVSRTIMHFSDGATLTDKDIYPHQLSEEQFQNLTSVERFVRGWHLSILKSELIKSFFIMTEAYSDMVMKPGRQGPPAIIALRALGCYLKDSDPPVKLVLAMDPLGNVFLESAWTKNFRPDGFSKILYPLKRGQLKKAMSKPIGEKGEQWTIVNEPPIRRVYGISDGLGCLISVNKNLRVKAEIRRPVLDSGTHAKSCHLRIFSE